MNILITGGNGFVARHLKEYLAQYYSISAPSHVELDLTNYDTVSTYLAKDSFDIIVHTANYDAINKFTTKSSQNTVSVNLRMFFNLLQNKTHFHKLICLDSGACYSKPHYSHNCAIKEDSFGKYIPQDEYGFSKYLMNKYASSLDFVIMLRFFGLYGEYDDYRHKYISHFCCRAIQKKDLFLESGDNKAIDYLYIKDACCAIQQCIANIDKLNYTNYNICTGEAYSLQDIAKTIAWKNKVSVLTAFNNENQTQIYCGNNERFKREFPRFSPMSITQGLSSIYDWYVQHPESYNPLFL